MTDTVLLLRSLAHTLLKIVRGTFTTLFKICVVSVVTLNMVVVQCFPAGPTQATS